MEKLKFKKLKVGQLNTNCYLVWTEQNSAFVIDPGDSGDYINKKILEFGLEPKFILATHGHFDHILAVSEVKSAFNIPFLIHKKDLFILKYAKKSAVYWLNLRNEPVAPIAQPDRFFETGQTINLDQFSFRVIATPGHTPGSVCLHCQEEKLLLSGDTLFAQGYGRTDLPGSDKAQMQKSLTKLFKLPQETRVLPGHGPETTIGEAKKFCQENFDIL